MKKIQQGIGLVEILVALLILAVGLLGFIALQYQAVEASSESTYRIQAINLARDLAERMRVNRGATATYESQLRDADKQISSSEDCTTTDCSAAEMAEFDVAQVVTKAHGIGMSINLIDCQGNSDGRNCIYVAWGDTAPTNGTQDGEGNCTTSTSYDPSSTCLIMEVY